MELEWARTRFRFRFGAVARGHDRPNTDVTNYNLAKQKGDKKEAQALYNQLQLESAEIANAARAPLDREGIDAYSTKPRELEYVVTPSATGFR